LEQELEGYKIGFRQIIEKLNYMEKADLRRLPPVKAMMKLSAETRHFIEHKTQKAYQEMLRETHKEVGMVTDLNLSTKEKLVFAAETNLKPPIVSTDI